MYIKIQDENFNTESLPVIALLTAESERGSRTVEVRGGRAAYPVGIAGECFRLRLSTEEEGEVYSLQAELEIRA